MRKIEKKLTAKQERFCREYIKDLNGTQAALRAGYSSARQMASDTLSKPYIRERIKELMAPAEKRLCASAEDVLARLTQMLNGEAFLTKTTMVDGEPVEVKYAPDYKDIARAAELLGKRHMLFSDHHTVDIGEDTINAARDLSLEEKEKRIKSIVERVLSDD